jgi:pyruvate,orthophosphate dikinase
VTVRLFDPPLHEFLPERDEDLEALGEDMGLSAENVRQIARNIRELNPMLGHRGCRLAISYPEIYDMQVRAVGEAVELAVSEGIDVQPELLVPLVSIPEELRRIRKRIDRILTEFDNVKGFPERIPVGSMIEVARACLLADEIAKHADFISFGTNDLTQSVFGISRDDASVFLPRYVNEGIIDANPFLSLDTIGVGELIETAVERARTTNPDIRVGLCGEQGGDPKSVAWLQQGVVDYISCSPYRVPIARLAAGQAAIQS